MTNNMASSGMWKMLYLPILIHITDGTINCTMSDAFCQKVWHLIVNAGPYAYLMLNNIQKDMVNINIGKYNIFHRPNETILFVMVKVCLHLQNILLFRNLKEFIIITGYKLFLVKCSCNGSECTLFT